MADFLEDVYCLDNIDNLLRRRVVNLVALVVNDHVCFIKFDIISDIVPRETGFFEIPNLDDKDITLCILVIEDLVGTATLDISAVSVWDGMDCVDCGGEKDVGG